MRILLCYGSNTTTFVMLYIISYDVSTSTPQGKRRLRRVAKACENYGIRVQNSVFECELDYAAFLQLKCQLNELIDSSVDSLRFYPMGKNGRQHVVHVGAKMALDVTAPLVL